MSVNPQDDNFEFVQTPSHSLCCPVCHDVCREPLITHVCNHSFCASCIFQSLDVEACCPLCRSRLKIEDLHPNLALAGIIQELQVYCSNKKYGCPTTVRLDSYHHHMMYCTYSPTVCDNSKYGCDFKGTAVSVKEHMQTCIFEKLKVYIDSNNAKLEKLEKTVTDQQQEISKLRRFISKFNMLPSADDVQDGISDDPAIGDEDEDVFLGLSSFPYGDITCQRTISQHRCGVTSLAFSRGLIYAGAHDGSTKIFDADTGQMIKDLNGHQVSVWALAVCHETERFFSAGSDGVIKVWDWNANQPNACVKTLTQHSGKIYGMVVSGNKLFSASSDKTVKVWDPITLENLATFTGHTDGVNNLTAIRDDKLATAGSDSTVKIWDVTTGTCIHTISCNSSEVLDVAFGDNMLFASTNDAVIHVYNINDNHSTAISTLAGHNWEVWQLAYINGAMFSASFDHTIKRWDVRNRMICNATLKGHQGFVHAMTLGHNNLITGCADRTIKIWQS